MSIAAAAIGELISHLRFRDTLTLLSALAQTSSCPQEVRRDDPERREGTRSPLAFGARPARAGETQRSAQLSVVQIQSQ